MPRIAGAANARDMAARLKGQGYESRSKGGQDVRIG